MPGVFHQPSRREFLKTSFLAGAAVILYGCQSSPNTYSSENELRWALLSDPHIGPGEAAKDKRGFDPCAQLKQVVPDIIATAPRGIILNGDAASREGLPEDYRELKTLLEPASRAAPIYIGLGNHDHRANFKEAFPPPPGLDAAVRDHLVLIMEEPFLRFIVLDSLLYTNKSAGLLGENQRAWLIDYLKSHREKPAILFVHHTLGEGDGDLLDAGRMFDIIRPNHQVKAIFYGHSHAWSITERQGVKLINLPALGYNFWQGEPVGWIDARFRPKGVDLTLHAIAGNREQNGQTTRIRWS
jgi:Icc protein